MDWELFPHDLETLLYIYIYILMNRWLHIPGKPYILEKRNGYFGNEMANWWWQTCKVLNRSLTSKGPVRDQIEGPLRTSRRRRPIYSLPFRFRQMAPTYIIYLYATTIGLTRNHSKSSCTLHSNKSWSPLSASPTRHCTAKQATEIRIFIRAKEFWLALPGPRSL